MRDRMTSTGRRVLTTFGEFTPGQKLMTVFAVIALGIGGYFFATWAATPTYAPLFSNLAPADASAIVDKLAADGVPYQLSNGGQTILVPQDQVYAQRLAMSGAGLPAQSDGGGYSLLDKQSLMTSDFKQHVDYKRALEGELAKTVKSISGVTAATVHLALPQKDLFSNDQEKPTASVLVATSTNRRLTPDQVQAVVHLVASSVEGLDPNDVTVVGADGMVMSGSGVDGGGAGGDLRSRATQQFEQRMGTALQQMLDQLVGPGHAVVQITADLDFDQTETRTETYVADPATPPLQESTKKEEYTGGGNPTGGVIAPDAGNGTGTNGGSYSQESVTRANAVGKVTETRRSAPGAVRRLSVAVLLDSATAQGADEARLQQLVSSAVGLDAQRGDTIAISTMPFDKAVAERAQSDLAAAQAAEKQEQMFEYAKTGLIVAAVVILVIAAMISSRRRNKRLQKLLRAEVAQLNGGAGAATALEGGNSAEQRAIEGGGDGEMAAIEAPSLVDPQLVQRQERQKEIADLVEKQPEEVAALLRTWLADRRN